ncbi:hypothetical protein KR032_011861, partial [Drosophila birchii]
FLFNIVITHVELFKDVPDPSKIDALVKIAGKSMTLPNSLINVGDFDVNQLFTFSRSPDALQSDLGIDGIVVSLRYDKSTLGNAVFILPHTSLDKISSEMNDLYLEETISLMRQKDSIGTVTVLIVLMIKCADKEHDHHGRRSSRWSTSTGKSTRKSSVFVPTTLPLGSPNKVEKKEECFGLGPTFNPQDVLFVVGDPDPLLNIPDEPCRDLSSEEGDERLRLDLQRYKSFNRRVKFPADDRCPGQKPSLRQLKRLTGKFGKIIESVAEKVKRMPTMEMLYEKPTATPTETQEVCTERYIPVPIVSEDEYGVKPIRYCPVCLYSMSWLPRYIPCPRCNTRTRAMLKAEGVETQMTANEIMAEQLVRTNAKDFLEPICPVARSVQASNLDEDNPQPMVNFDSDAECPPCRCTCQDGKMCTHCRIRKLCEDIFNTADDAKMQRQFEEEQRLARYTALARSSQDFSLIPGPADDDRPHLYRVFSEMKSLYALHDTKKIHAMQRRCMSQTLLTTRSAPSASLYRSQHDRINAPVGESINRQKAGHKHCLPPDPTVPRRHGWNWRQSREARKYGWRPGAIMRAAMHVMRFFLTSKEDRELQCQTVANPEELQRQNSPVLNICKRNNEIFVTLRPLPTLGNGQKPITFRIVKSHLAVALRQIKRALKDQGFEKCTCHKSLMLCSCRDALEKFELNKALRKECQRRLIEPCPEHLVLTDTSVSDLEFNLDVHPPSTSCRAKIKTIRSCMNYGTQTSKQDQLPPPPKYPMQVDPYYRGFDCALGDRNMGNTAFGLPGEEVFEDGVFGMEGGGPHGPNPMPCGRVASGRGRRQVPSGPRSGAWKGFPVKAEKGKGAINDPIPVRYPKRLLKPAQDAAKAAKQAVIDAAEKKKKGPDMLKYLQAKGTLVRPWNPIDGKDTRPRPPK